MTGSSIAANSSPASHEASEHRYQTESERSGDYSTSRWNALKWQLRREDIMICTGNRCPYRFCDLPDEGLPSVGTLCPWEQYFGSLFSQQLTDLLGADVLRPFVKENPDLVWKWTIAFLLANRASVRLSRASEEIQAACACRLKGPIDHAPYNHAALTLRYLTAAHNRIGAIRSQLKDALTEALAKKREARIRTEMLAAGYWNPARGDAPPAIEDAPDWIIKKVDGT